MPNWAYNQLKLSHKDRTMIERAVTAFDKESFLQEFIPCPQSLRETVSGWCGDPEEQARLEQQQQANVAQFGHKDWYDWCVANWGTKWDARDIDYDDGSDTVFFNTAWSPPIELFNWFARQYPDSEMQLEFIEEGCQFEGVWSYNPKDGFALNEWTPESEEEEY